MRQNIFVSLSLIASIALCFRPSVAQSAEIAGVLFPQKVTMEGSELTLNGVGLRTATIFSVKVYAMGMYLEQPEPNPQKIIESRGRSFVRMHFLRSVSADKLANAWIEGVKNNFPNASDIEGKVGEFSKSMRDVEEGDQLTMYFADEKIVTELNGEKISEMSGATLQQAILSCWFGPHPPNEALKSGLLGEK